ncbi:MAG: cation diffusion facilitator family transporter [Chloroflexota bacterium]
MDSALESDDRGIWALKMSLAILATTALLQAVVVVASGSTGLLADTIHNLSDSLTAIPLWLAFSLGRRPSTRRYTFGFGRAEDLAGTLIVLVVLASALAAAYASIQKLLHPQPVTNLGWVAAAAVLGFAGNEVVAVFRMRVGRQMGSAALVADGQHARADGLTSLAVLLGVGGAAAGFPLADPIVGLLIALLILAIVRSTALSMWRRLMDAIDPDYVAVVEEAAGGVHGVHQVTGVRVRWLGHRLVAELNVVVDGDMPTRESHRIVEEVRHELFHRLPQLADIIVHADPLDVPASHALTDHHAAPVH